MGVLRVERERVDGGVRQAIGIGGECWAGRMDLLERLLDYMDGVYVLEMLRL
jgi:hypothetical protein